MQRKILIAKYFVQVAAIDALHSQGLFSQISYEELGFIEAFVPIFLHNLKHGTTKRYFEQR